MGNENRPQHVRGYKDLQVWQKGMDLTAEVYRITEKLPRREQFGLTQQVRRAAVSVPSNIAEGHSRQSTGDYRHHLQMARGSVAEVETQLLLTERLTLLAPTDLTHALTLTGELSRMLAALIARMR